MGITTRGTARRVLVAGSGAREHALAWACRRSADVAEVICAPGNGGTGAIAENVDLRADDVGAVTRVARERDVDLVVIGPDAAVAAGLADACAAEGIAVFGPTAAAGRIESSKRFAKQLMDEAGIPTACWRAGGGEDRDALRAYAAELGGRCAVKADGLALGKGVTVCDSVAEAWAAIDGCLVEGRFGEAGTQAIVEERLEGREVSVFALSDGERVWLLPPACDYKHAHDGDLGPNTGGMGAYAPPSGVDVDPLLDEALRLVIQPCVDALRERGIPYRGCLYAGLMLTPRGIRVLEFNARFGDPETQVVLPLLASDAAALFTACAHGELGAGREPSRAGAAVGVVAASAGYPGAVMTGAVISGTDSLDDGVLCFHGGTRGAGGDALRTAGGRVLTVVATGSDHEQARQRAYENIARVSFDGMWTRRDIARLGAATAPLAR